MKEAALESLRFVEGMSYADIQDDSKTQRAVTMNLVIVAEAAAKIEERFPDFAGEHPEIGWVAIRGMRNRLVHDYFVVNFETVWSTIEIELPRLIQQVEVALIA